LLATLYKSPFTNKRKDFFQMADRTIVTIHAVDGAGKPSRFEYESVANVPSDANVTGMVADWKALTNLGYEKISVTYNVDTPPVPADNVLARIGDTAKLTAHKGAAYGGTYSFRLAAIKTTLLNGDDIIIGSAEVAAFLEWFDDGDGLLGVAGPFTISDGEQLAENGADPTLPSGLTAISGELTGKRS
jgi:hypothetical protein